jgi:hypothetical protein
MCSNAPSADHGVARWATVRYARGAAGTRPHESQIRTARLTAVLVLHCSYV